MSPLLTNFVVLDSWPLMALTVHTNALLTICLNSFLLNHSGHNMIISFFMFGLYKKASLVIQSKMFLCVRALVFVAHGAGEHCSTYADVAQTLTQHSLYVFAHDHGE